MVEFMALLAGLSPQSAFMNVLAMRQNERQKNAPTKVITDPAEIRASMAQTFGLSPAEMERRRQKQRMKDEG